MKKKKIAILSLTFACAMAFGGSTLVSNNQGDIQNQISNNLDKLENYANMTYDWSNPQNMLLNDDYSLFYSNGNYSLQNMRGYMMYGSSNGLNMYNDYNGNYNMNGNYNNYNNGGMYANGYNTNNNVTSNDFRNVNYSYNTNRNTSGMYNTTNLNRTSNSYNSSTNTGTYNSSNNYTNNNMASNNSNNTTYSQPNNTSTSTTINVPITNNAGRTYTTNNTGSSTSTMLKSNTNTNNSAYNSINNTNRTTNNTISGSSTNANSSMTNSSVRNNTTTQNGQTNNSTTTNYTRNMQSLAGTTASRTLTDYSGSLSTTGTSLMSNIKQTKQALNNANFNNLDQSNMRALRAYAFTLNNITRKIEFGQQDFLSNVTRMSILQGSSSSETSAMEACNLDVKATLASRIALLECANEALVQINKIIGNNTNSTTNSPVNISGSTNQTYLNQTNTNANTTNLTNQTNTSSNTNLRNTTNYGFTTLTSQDGKVANNTTSNKISANNTAVTTSAAVFEEPSVKQTKPVRACEDDVKSQVEEPNKEELEKSIADTLNENKTPDVQKEKGFFKKFGKKNQ